MVELETIITLYFMMYIATLDAYELHREDDKVPNEFIDEC